MCVENILANYAFDAERNLWVNLEPSPHAYSDGDQIENHIFSVVQNASDKGTFSAELRQHMVDWPSTYHLSPMRSNLLRPILDSITGPVLEIGAGMGPITRFLGEEGKDVFAIEGSERRASIAAERCRDLPNVRVVADQFQNFVGSDFQTITLIGVLEYSRIYFPSEAGRDPVDLMLERVAEMLAPDGQLVLAIENKYGLKYFSGYPEDHLGRSMAGIENNYTDGGVVTFGRKELNDRLSVAGLGHQKWWFPLPDYKLVSSVISTEGAEGSHGADLSPLLVSSVVADRQRPPVTTFLLQRAWPGILQNGLLGDLANSFLVQASKRDLGQTNLLASVYSANRAAKYTKETRIVLEGDTVTTEVVGLSRLGVEDVKPELGHSLSAAPWFDGENWASEFASIMTSDSLEDDDLRVWLLFWVESVIASCGSHVSIDPEAAIPGHLVDAVPQNMIRTKDGPRWFDLEWQIENLTLGFLVFRGLVNSVLSLEAIPSGSRFRTSTVHSLLSHLWVLIFSEGNSKTFETYWEQEIQLQRVVAGIPDMNIQSWETLAESRIPLRPEFADLSKAQQDIFALRLLNDDFRTKVSDLGARNEDLSAQVSDLGVLINDLQERVTGVQLRHDAVTGQLENVLSSRSWRYTAWLRKLANLFRAR